MESNSTNQLKVPLVNSEVFRIRQSEVLMEKYRVKWLFGCRIISFRRQKVHSSLKRKKHKVNIGFRRFFSGNGDRFCHHDCFVFMIETRLLLKFNLAQTEIYSKTFKLPPHIYYFISAYNKIILFSFILLTKVKFNIDAYLPIYASNVGQNLLKNTF